MAASCRRLLTDPWLGTRGGRAIPEPGMPPLTGREELDGLRDLAPSLLTGLVATMLHPLLLQRPPDPLHRRVVRASPLPTHRGTHAERPQGGLIRLGTLLRPAIGVMNEPPGWTLGVAGLQPCPLPQVRRHPGVPRMADHLTGVELLNASQLPPPCHGRPRGHIGAPGLGRSSGGNGLSQHVRGHRPRGRRIRGGREPAHRCTAQAPFLPQPLEAADPSWKAVLTPFGLQPVRAIRLAGPHRGGLDRPCQPRVLLGAGRGAAGAPGLVPASGHGKDPAQQTPRIRGPPRPPERVPGRCALAQYAVAFFTMSRSIRASARARWSRDRSASRSVTGRRLSPNVASCHAGLTLPSS